MRILLVFQEQVSSFRPVQMHLKTCHEILVLELIGDSCSWQMVVSVHYQFKLPVKQSGRNTANMYTTKYEERYSMALP